MADMPVLQVRRQTSESFRPTPLWIPFASRTESTHEQTKSLAASVVRQLAFFPSPTLAENWESKRFDIF